MKGYVLRRVSFTERSTVDGSYPLFTYSHLVILFISAPACLTLDWVLVTLSHVTY